MSRSCWTPPASGSRQRVNGSPRPASLEGRTVGLLDISKPRGDVFLDRLGERLAAARRDRRRFRSRRSPSRRPVDLRHEIATKCDVVIEALAD